MCVLSRLSVGTRCHINAIGGYLEKVIAARRLAVRRDSLGSAVRDTTVRADPGLVLEIPKGKRVDILKVTL